MATIIRNSFKFHHLEQLLVGTFKIFLLNSCFWGMSPTSSSPLLYPAHRSSSADWTGTHKCHSGETGQVFQLQTVSYPNQCLIWRTCQEMCTDHSCQFQKLNNSLVVHCAWDMKPTSWKIPQHLRLQRCIFLAFVTIVCMTELWYLTGGKYPSAGRSPNDRWTRRLSLVLLT